MGLDNIWEEGKVRFSKPGLLIISIDRTISKLHVPHLQEEHMLDCLRK